jgi:hypothetical protein
MISRMVNMVLLRYRGPGRRVLSRTMQYGCQPEITQFNRSYRLIHHYWQCRNRSHWAPAPRATPGFTLAAGVLEKYLRTQ